jgi:type IV secretion system protein VirB10
LSDHDSEGKFPDPHGENKISVKTRLKRALRRRTPALIITSCIVMVLIVLAILSAHSAAQQTGRAFSRIKSGLATNRGEYEQEIPLPPGMIGTERNGANGDYRNRQTPAANDPQYRAYLECRQRGRCGTAAATTTSSTGGSAAANNEGHSLRETLWKARFAPPDGGKEANAPDRREQEQLKESRADEDKDQAKDPAAENDAGHRSTDQTPVDDGVKKAPYDQDSGPKYLLFAGVTQISCRLMNGIVADMNGPVLCRTTEPVYSWEREAVLIPKGTFLTGTYERVMADDQERVAIAIDSMLMPDGYRVTFPHVGGLDQTGHAGVRDKVDRHYAQLFLTTIGISAAGAGAQIGIGSGGYSYSPVDLLRVGFGANMSQAAMQELSRLHRRPTLMIPDGQVINVFAPVDMELPAYRNHRMNPHM